MSKRRARSVEAHLTPHVSRAPGEALIVALVLAIVPYLLLRGLVTRLTSKNSKLSITVVHKEMRHGF